MELSDTLIQMITAIMITLCGMQSLVLLFIAFTTKSVRRGRLCILLFVLALSITGAVLTPEYPGSDVIILHHDGTKQSTRCFGRFVDDNGQSHLIEKNKKYLYFQGEGEESCSLTIYPVYYTARIKREGKVVEDMAAIKRLNLNNGDFIDITHIDFVLCDPPLLWETYGYKRQETFFCLTCKNIPDNFCTYYKPLIINTLHL